MMGEIDTKPIESVQSTLSFFDQGIDHRKHSPNKDDEIEKGRELESIEKELANIKVKLEAKESAYKQALLKLDHHHKTADHLSTLLKTSDLQKDFYINESRESKLRVNELESTLHQLSHQLSESQNAQHQLIQVTNDLESTQGQLMQMELELALLKQAKIESLSQIQAMEMSLNEEKLQKEEILKQVSELNQLKEDMEMQEKKNSSYIGLLEDELKQVRAELVKAKEEENEAQVEVALLKFELHKGRSKMASFEADEARVQGEKSALFNALQQMGIESEELKQENRLLKEAMKSADTEAQEQEQAVILIEQSRIEKIEEEKQSCDEMSVDAKELESVRREMEVVTAKIGELRTRAEQAISRAEAAEKMKGELEEQIKKRREQKERRKAALVALREESISRDVGSIIYATSVKNYQPLGKVLNMKF